MGYRDDADALYERSLSLQRELDAANERLAERERELEQARFTPPEPRPRYVHTTGEHWISRIVNPPPPPPAPEPVSAPGEIEFLAPFQRRAAVLGAAREHLDRLSDDMLVAVGAIIEELALEQPNAGLAEHVRALRGEIASAYRRRQTR